jgi:hypothetical protein
MVSKAELIEQLDNERKRAALLEYERNSARADALGLQCENAAHRERERIRMRREHTERQRARQDAEREDKRKRRRELADGMLRLADASEWAIVHDERGSVLELTVPLAADVEPIVHGVLTKRPVGSMSFIPRVSLPNPDAPTLDEIRRAMGFSAGGVTHV